MPDGPLLSYPKDAFGNKKALRVFICSDLSLSDKEILSHYTHRWKIEVMFKQQKVYMGLKSFMIRSAKAIDRLFVILPLAHLFFIVLFDASLSLSATIRRFRALLCSFQFCSFRVEELIFITCESRSDREPFFPLFS